MIALGLACAHAGFVALCLAMERHHEQALGQRRIPPGRQRLLAGGGWLLLAASLVPVVATLGWGLGTVAWCGLLTAAALPVVVVLSWRPRWVMGTAVAGLGIGAMAALV